MHITSCILPHWQDRCSTGVLEVMLFKVRFASLFSYASLCSIDKRTNATDGCHLCKNNWEAVKRRRQSQTIHGSVINQNNRCCRVILLSQYLFILDYSCLKYSSKKKKNYFHPSHLDLKNPVRFSTEDFFSLFLNSNFLFFGIILSWELE